MQLDVKRTQSLLQLIALDLNQTFISYSWDTLILGQPGHKAKILVQKNCCISFLNLSVLIRVTIHLNLLLYVIQMVILGHLLKYFSHKILKNYCLKSKENK